jgi:apolipoprotein N-acyltransferase
MKSYKLLLLSLLSGVLLWLSWIPIGISFLVFIAFVPLLFISDSLLSKKSRVPFWQGIIYSFPAFALWNGSTTWWIWNSTPEGSIAAMLLNSILMSIIFGLWHCFKNQKPSKLAVTLSFIVFWISFEFIHLNWDLSWPWLNLGNVFAPHTQFVQWYEYTGTFGGTLWILATNFLLYYLIINIKKNIKKTIIYSCAVAAIIIVPIVFSLIRYNSYQLHTQNPIEAMIVQQNTNPWTEEYEMSNAEQAVRILRVAIPKLTDKTELLICPESAIPHNISSEALINKTFPQRTSRYWGFVLFDSLIYHYPNLNMVVGLSTFKNFNYKATPTTREEFPNHFVEYYNTSVCLNSNWVSGIYYKSKLVPGVEKMPYPKIFGFLEKFVIDLGGTSGSLGIDTAQRAFPTTIQQGRIKIGAPICYESMYGELFAQFVKDGAQVMSVITNDGWWKDTPGHEQHFSVSKLRAVETRRTVLRAANTGTSAFIDEKGDVHQETKFNERIAIKQVVYPNDELTFYVKHGDYLARIANVLSIIMLIYGTFQWIFRKLGYVKLEK